MKRIIAVFAILTLAMLVACTQQAAPVAPPVATPEAAPQVAPQPVAAPAAPPTPTPAVTPPAPAVTPPATGTDMGTAIASKNGAATTHYKDAGSACANAAGDATGADAAKAQNECCTKELGFYAEYFPKTGECLPV